MNRGVMSRRQPTSVRAEDTLFEGLCERLRQKRTRMTIHVAKNEADSMRIAIDAQIMLRNHARRMIIGAAEFGRWNVVVPITAATIAKMHYAKVSTNYVTKKTVWDSKLAGEEISDEALGLRIHDALERTSAGFAQWIDDESRRNDRIFEIGERTRKAQGVAMELARAKVVDDPPGHTVGGRRRPLRDCRSARGRRTLDSERKLQDAETSEHGAVARPGAGAGPVRKRAATLHH